MYFYCEKCKKKYPLNTHSYQCECGGLFRVYKDPGEEYVTGVTLGEHETPILPFDANGLQILLKMEDRQPTGSFKDRGSYRMINELKYHGVTKIAMDSAGNAGASVAAYAAAADIDCTIYVPDDISQELVKQIEMYGAKVVKVANGRANACAAVKQNLGDAYYASHVYNPLFAEGVKSMAGEIYKQLGNKVPDYIFIPVGNGTMLLGLFLGFLEIGRMPHLVAVQSSKCAPLYEAFHGTEPQPKKMTIAESIRIAEPKRLNDMLNVLHASQGDVITVEDVDILRCRKMLGKKGIDADLTAAAALAGAMDYFKDGKPDNYNVIVPVTGTGLKR